MKNISISTEVSRFNIRVYRSLKIPTINKDLLIGNVAVEGVSTDVEFLENFQLVVEKQPIKADFGYSLIRNFPNGRVLKTYFLSWEEVKPFSPNLQGESNQWIFRDFQALEVDGEELYDKLAYVDGIKLFFHFYKSFELFCNEYADKDFWKNILNYKVRVKSNGSEQLTGKSNYEDGMESGEIYIWWFG